MKPPPSPVLGVLAALGIAVTEQRGDRAWALCPYHPDKKPSWFIRTRGGHYGEWHCYSCKAGGYLAMLVRDRLALEDTAAAEAWLEAGDFKAPPEDLPETVRVEVMAFEQRGFRLPPGVEFGDVAEWPATVRDYLLGERHVQAWQVDRWGIGYALEGPLEGRVVVVVRDGAGRVASYMGRDFARQEKRYHNPHGREGADLDVLFGEQNWPLRDFRGAVVVCEGAFNALAVERVWPGAEDREAAHAWGLPAVAAIGGSVLRPMHALKLAAFREVLVLTDPDHAGEKVALELAGALGRHVVVKRVTLAPGTTRPIPGI